MSIDYLGLHKRFRLRENGTHGDWLKRPRKKDWQKIIHTDEKVATWTPESHPSIGILTGGRTQGLDFDHYAPENLPKFKDFVEKLTGRRLPVVETGTRDRYHVTFYVPKGETRNTIFAGELYETGKILKKSGLPEKKLRPIVEGMGEGKSLVAPGSLHPNGNDYRYIDDLTYVDDIIELNHDQWRKVRLYISVNFDRRPKKPVDYTPKKKGYDYSIPPTGEYAHLKTCEDIADHFFGNGIIEGSEIRYPGHNGLLVNRYADMWNCRAAWDAGDELAGGGRVEMLAYILTNYWNQPTSVDQAYAMLREPRPAKDDPNYDLILPSKKFLGDVLDPKVLPSRVMLISPPGTGKTEWAIKVLKANIIVVPTIALVEQIVARHPHVDAWCSAIKTARPDSTQVVTTIDKCLEVLAMMSGRKNLRIFVDEIHEFHEAFYRARVYNNVLKLHESSAKIVVYATGTPGPFPEDTSLASIQEFRVKADQPTITAQDIVHKPGEGDASLVKYVAKSLDQGKLAHILLNNKGKRLSSIEMLIRERIHDAKIAQLNSMTRESDDFQHVITEEEFDEDNVEVAFSTPVIGVGNNIRNTSVDIYVMSIHSPMALEQAARRYREEPPTVYRLLPEREDVFVDTTFQDLVNEECEKGVSINNSLNKHHMRELNSLNPADVAAMREWNRCIRPLAKSQYVTITTKSDGLKYFDVNYAAVCGGATIRWRSKLWNGPSAFKYEMESQYGWQWLDDIHDEEELTAEERDMRKEYANAVAFKQQERMTQIVQQIKEDGEDSLKTNRDTGNKDTMYNAIRTNIEKLLAIIGTWEFACDYVTEVGHNDRAVNTLFRQLEIEKTRRGPYNDGITYMMYNTHEIGQQMTPAEMAAWINVIYEDDSFTHPFVTYGERITERTAVKLYKEYFELKRTTKRVNGKRYDVWEIVNDRPIIVRQLIDELANHLLDKMDVGDLDERAQKLARTKMRINALVEFNAATLEQLIVGELLTGKTKVNLG